MWEQLFLLGKKKQRIFNVEVELERWLGWTCLFHCRGSINTTSLTQWNASYWGIIAKETASLKAIQACPSKDWSSSLVQSKGHAQANWLWNPIKCQDPFGSEDGWADDLEMYSLQQHSQQQV